uniref:Uncharacterized protein n=1 Tax=uncultured marine group II/III euryarchaeote KM3_160_F12 TaxID=1457912 RepID=A0A075GMU2_9EURY|nr:hypothetical protein [uncultured marine group II/III euryarchaeote KM3_160_F12]
MTTRGPSEPDESTKIDAGTLPVELRELWEVMLRLDPHWNIEKWLANRASEELKLVEANLAKEKMRLEQRLSRVTALAERMRKRGIQIDEIKWNDPHQRNLFDIFPHEQEGEGEESEQESAEPIDEEHPAAILLDYLPGETGDDPLLAIVAQHILLEMDELLSEGSLPVSLDELGDSLESQGINPDEVIEALEWLLQQGEISEVDEDKFTIN